MQLTEKDKARFWSKVDVGEDHECWEWQAFTFDGYGRFNLNSKNVLAHRVSYSIANGAIKPGMLVMHSCDNPGCVNPAHLSEGTNADNSADKVSKNRQPRGESSVKAKLTEQEVKYIRFLHTVRGENGIQIAKRYALDKSTVYNILNGRTWKHI